MNTLSRTITGIIAVLLGLFLIGVGVLREAVALIYGIPMLIIGVFIFVNKSEDNIEKIKNNEK